MSNVTTKVSESEAITKVVQNYIDGAKSGRGERNEARSRPCFISLANS